MTPKSKLKTSSSAGQTMLLVVMMISGVVLSISLVAGILMIYQIRQAGNFTNSAKAIFAADTGVGWWFFSQTPSYNPAYNSSSINGAFGNGASFEIVELPNGTAKIVGQAGNSKRALLVESLAVLPGSASCEPMDIVLLIDASFDGGSDLNAIKLAAKGFASDLSPSPQGTHIGAIGVDDAAPPVTLMDDLTQINSAIDNIPNPIVGDDFNLAAGILGAHTALSEASDRLGVRDVIIILTGQRPNVPTTAPGAEALAQNQATSAKNDTDPISIVTILIDSPGAVTSAYYSQMASHPTYAYETTQANLSPAMLGTSDSLCQLHYLQCQDQNADVMLLVDTTIGSMGSVRTGLNAFVNRLNFALPPNPNQTMVGQIGYTDTYYGYNDPSTFRGSLASVLNAISQLVTFGPNNISAFDDAINGGASAILNNRPGDPAINDFMLIVTDSMPTAGDKGGVSAAAQLARDAGITTYVAALGSTDCLDDASYYRGVAGHPARCFDDTDYSDLDDLLTDELLLCP
ncbi:MAG: hypothetical protein G01um101420_730 [Parcubacteria group bacterium Gr01-1014_20]|nr:MAG: hypothetical protein G01um101420_730 [Parcubacteria group bacterium Gr01-1014_20]